MVSPFNPLDYPLCLQTPQRFRESAWIEHIPFGMAIVQMTAPRTVVELGVHRGESYLAFCQAVAALRLSTACFGVDTWRGDEHTGFYGDEVLAVLRDYHEPLYGGFSRLVQSTFDSALSHFGDGTIDLLHIDGLHTFAAVAHDFEAWRPKLSERAVVLFHDINARERGFGVWHLWEELSAQFPHFSFHHAHGLGVLAVGEQVPEGVRRLTESSEEQSVAVRALFFALGSRLTQQADLARTRAEAKAYFQQVRALGATTEEQVRALGATTQELHARTEQVAHLESVLKELNESVSFRLGLRATAPLRWIRDKTRKP